LLVPAYFRFKVSGVVVITHIDVEVIRAKALSPIKDQVGVPGRFFSPIQQGIDYRQLTRVC